MGKASANNTSSVGMSGLMHTLERHVLRRAIWFILAGTLVRISAVAFNSTFPYNSWPIVIQLFVDVTVVIGTVGVADIMFNVSCSRTMRLNAEIDALRTSEEYQPNPNWSPKRFAQQTAVLKAKLEHAVQGKRRDRALQVGTAALCGVIMLFFGGAFEAITFNRITVLGTIIGFITVFALLPLQFAVFALYREVRASITERADAIIEEGVEGALEAAREAVKNGTATQDQITLLERSSSNQFHKSVLQTMRKRDTSETYLTTREIYANYSITDGSGQAQIRRRVAEAGDKHEPERCPVIKDPASGKWITPVAALGYLFPQEFIDRLRANASRAQSKPSGATLQALAELRAYKERAEGGDNIVPYLAQMFRESAEQTAPESEVSV